MTDSVLPLAGLRVLEISTAWAGPMLGRILRDFGADVVKVETLDAIDNWRGAVKGDDRSRYPDGDPGARPYNRSAWFNTQNLGKRSLGLDLKAPAARSAIEALVATCDIVVSNFAAGALGRMRMSYPDLCAIRPDIMLLEMVVTGEGGPLANARGVGPTMEALAGMTVLTGYGDGVPQRTGPAYVDPIGALNGAMAVLLAVYHRERTGRGQRIELAQRESLMHWYGERLLLFAEDGIEIAPHGNDLDGATPHGAFRARGDDEWVAIAVFDDAQWRALAAALGRPELADDPRFADASARADAATEVRDAIESWTRGRDKRAIADELQRRGVCAAPVCSGKDVHDDPQLAATGFLFDVDHPETGRHRYHGLPFRFAGAADARRVAAPVVGQHTDALLRDWAGLDDQAIAELHRTGVALQASIDDERSGHATES
jgi:crotonobetainyl-CoA:carnitine CoA-transferase CaiB-like acyl-CoA transferase